jgi:hypothetical protein
MRPSVLLFLCILYTINSTAQSHLRHRIYGGAFAGMQWGTISGVRGFQAEYIIVSESDFGASASISHTLKYTHENMQLLNASDDYQSNNTNFMVHGYFFPNPNWRKSTWFVQPGMGVTQEHFFKPKTTSIVSFGFELGGGGIVEVGSFMSIKLGMYLTFGPNSGSLHTFRASIGF